MYTTPWKHTGVKPDGTFKNKPGAVNVKKGVTISAPRGGCGMLGCNCSPGHWIVISNGRTKAGVLTGKTIHFDTRKELLEYMKRHGIKPTRG